MCDCARCRTDLGLVALEPDALSLRQPVFRLGTPAPDTNGSRVNQCLVERIHCNDLQGPRTLVEFCALPTRIRSK